ncbi:MAG TPA: glycosyltransferase [Pyrinomonadaceae bacterium]|nr:glycosyltransferase [Pyrinomonadaceae bacterium]
MLKTSPELIEEELKADAAVAAAPRTDEDESARRALDQISVIVPVKNEEASIERLLLALVEQSLRPSEIVVTDGGSDDRTREIIRDFGARSPVPVVLVETDHAFPGRGRNLAIERAANDWLASIDGGNVPEKEWLRELIETARANPGARIVYGRYKALTESYFTECAAIAYLLPVHVFNRFVASSLIHRSAWEVAGGFREDLRSAEDLLFFRKLDAAGVSWARSDRAFVCWSLQTSVAGTFRRFATYSRYNLKAGLASDWHVSVVRLYVLMLLSVLAGLFLWWPLLLLPPALVFVQTARRINRWYAERSLGARLVELLNPRRVLTVAFVKLLVDAAMFEGIRQWFAKDYRGRTRGVE